MNLLRLISFSFFALISFSALAADASRTLRVAAKEDRVALVIGNSAYPGVGALRNPVNDARAMAKALRELNFEVIERVDVTQKEMNRAIAQFGDKLSKNTTALFYYAGHGMQVRGKNFLIPVDAEISSEGAVRAEAVDVDVLLEQFASRSSPLNLVILDACRNNPFERRFRSGGSGGLAQIDAPQGTMIAYATAPGKVASDGAGKNGIYTGELLKAMRDPGLPVEQVFKKVRSNIIKLTKGDQTPWESSSLTGEFYFKPGASELPVTPMVDAGAQEKDIWDGARNVDSEESYQAYLNQYPKGRYVSEAKKAIAKLKANAANAAQVAEQEAWKTAQQTNTVEGYQHYLSLYPAGRFAALAKAGISKIEKASVTQLALAKPTSAIQYKPGDVFKDCAECPEMVVIPAGSFQMGANGNFTGNARFDSWYKPVHSVSIAQPFAMGKTEVTQGQWRAIMGVNPSSFVNCGDNCPVENISWDDVQIFVKRLSQKTGKQYRLPSEAEWEYACRAGGAQAYCGSDSVDTVAWYAVNSGRQTHPVALMQANAWGLFDMIGNVYEWTEDCWNPNYSGAPSVSIAWKSGDCSQHVLRGGSWYFDAKFIHLAVRSKQTSGNQITGFRLAMTLP